MWSRKQQIGINKLFIAEIKVFVLQKNIKPFFIVLLACLSFSKILTCGHWEGII